MEHPITKWCVCDEASDLWSDLYDTQEEAEKDLNEDLTHDWSTNARVVVVWE